GPSGPGLTRAPPTGTTPRGNSPRPPPPAGNSRAYGASPGAQAAPAVVVLQEIFGINADLKETCEWLAKQGFIAVCPDLFWRMEPGVSMSKLDQAEWQRGFQFYQKFDRERGVADISATLELPRNVPRCPAN